MRYKWLQQQAAVLGERFDVVQVMVSTSDSEGTLTLQVGVGNNHARYGMMKEFVTAKDNEMRRL